MVENLCIVLQSKLTGGRHKRVALFVSCRLNLLPTAVQQDRVYAEHRQDSCCDAFGSLTARVVRSLIVMLPCQLQSNFTDGSDMLVDYFCKPQGVRLLRRPVSTKYRPLVVGTSSRPLSTWRKGHGRGIGTRATVAGDATQGEVEFPWRNAPAPRHLGFRERLVQSLIHKFLLSGVADHDFGVSTVCVCVLTRELYSPNKIALSCE